TVLPAISNVATTSLAFGSHASSVPGLVAASAALKAARRLRVVVPTVVKKPPAYAVAPDTSSVLTVLLRFGFQASNAPLLLLNAARRLRAAPPINVNRPPAYTDVPKTDMSI